MPQSADFIIVGTGLAGLQLALAFLEDEQFSQHQFLLIDPSLKKQNDKTWCFWEKGNGKWDHLVSHSWENGNVITTQQHINLSLAPYRYKMIRSIDFYTDCIQRLKKHPNVHIVQAEVKQVDEDKEQVRVKTDAATYIAQHVFDSRLPEAYQQQKRKFTTIHQHFKGWMIETQEPVFDADCFTMMDFRLRWKNSTSFTYLLPLSPTKAFVEYTFFTPYLVKDDVYDSMLTQYIRAFITPKHYSITETEKGIIPMTDFPFHQFHSKRITKIGTAGGWVKASTGYAFKHTEKKISKLIKNLKLQQKPALGLTESKYQFYDKVFLKVLETENDKGEWIFENFYRKNSIQSVFAYLDEETSLATDIAVMGSLFSSAFIKAFFKTIS